MYTSSLCCLADYSQMQPLETTSIDCVTAPWAESRCGLPGYLWLKLYPAIRLGCLSSKVSPGEGPTFRSSRWSGRVQILTSSKIQFLTGCGPEAPQISATGVSPQSSSQHGSCFPQSEGVRGGTQLIFYSLEASHLSQPHQWEGVKWGISASRQSHWRPAERMPSQR